MLEYPIIPAILCGGSGTRLWPLSRNQYPKQFIKFGASSLFAQTVDRVNALGYDKAYILCNHEQRFLAATELYNKNLDLKKYKIFLEPIARNTAPAIALAAFAALEENEYAQILVLPSDHLLEPLEVLKTAIKCGTELANQGKIVTFGIVPTAPETGYGYISKGKEIVKNQAYNLEAFIEKPNKEKAEQLLKEACTWNSGMFLLQAKVYLDELKKFDNSMYTACEEIWSTLAQDLDFTRFDAKLFASCPANSIDYAVMEKTALGVVIPLDIHWSDLGSWDAIYKAYQNDKADENGNVCIGDTLLYDTKNSYIHASSKLVAVLGLSDIAVIETKDAVLVGDINRSQDVKCLIEVMKKENRSEFEQHCVVHRPWGYYESITQSERFQVKRITVKPKGILSMQLHHHRSEHWIVVKGTALVTCGETKKLLREDESVYIPLGEKHRLENPGCIPLEVVEIQTGSYLGEDDIQRFEDLYGR